jgi:hypothetical protein
VYRNNVQHKQDRSSILPSAAHTQRTRLLWYCPALCCYSHQTHSPYSQGSRLLCQLPQRLGLLR